MRRLALTLLLALAAIAAAEEVGIAPSAYTDDPVLAHYLQEAAEAHPTLRGLHAEWLAQLEKIPQATSLEDPMFTFGQFLASDIARYRIAVGQRFPWFGTLKLRGEREAIEAEALFAEMEAQRNRLLADVKQAYVEYAYLATQLAVLQSQLAVLEQVEDTITTQFGLGFAREDALVRAQIETTQLLDTVRGLERYRPVLSARLAERIGRSVHELLPFPEPLPIPHYEIDEPVVLDVIAQQSPALTAAQHRVEVQKASVKLAGKERYPSIALEIEYASMKRPRTEGGGLTPITLNSALQLTGMVAGRVPVDARMAIMDLYELNMAGESMPDMKDDVQVSVTMNVPLWRKRIRAEVREAMLRQDAAEAAEVGLTLQLQRAAIEVLYEISDALRRAQLYESELLPQAERVYESVLVGYSVGIDADVLDLLDSVDQLLAFQLEQHAAYRDARVAAAELEYLMGRPLDFASAEFSAAAGSS